MAQQAEENMRITFNMQSEQTLLDINNQDEQITQLAVYRFGPAAIVPL